MLVQDHNKGTRLLSNYRPVSLTNISYKIFASMKQSRLEQYMDSRLRSTQFGFRKRRSTSQPIHVLRRLLEVFGQTSWDSSQRSSTFTQTKGLRQGCPLSPYLFSFVLTHLFADEESKYQELYGQIAGVFQVPHPLWDLEYADDTVLLSCSAS